MDHVSSVFKTVLKKRGLYDEALAGLALSIVKAWIEQQLPQHSRALRAARVERGALIILAENSIALVECNQRLPELLAELRAHVSNFPISELRVMRA